MAHTFPSYTILLRSVCVCVHTHTRAHVFSHIHRFMTSWTIARRAPRSSEFSRQEYWSRLPSPNSGDLPNLGIKPTCLGSPALAGSFFTSWAMREAPTSEYQDSKRPTPLYLKLTSYGTSTYFNKNNELTNFKKCPGPKDPGNFLSRKGVWPVITSMRLLLSSLLFLLLKQSQFAPNKQANEQNVYWSTYTFSLNGNILAVGFNWKWNSSLVVQIYYSYTSPSGFHLGNKSFWWWMRQYLCIILQSKQRDFQFKSTIRLLLQSSNEDSDFGEKIIYS